MKKSIVTLSLIISMIVPSGVQADQANKELLMNLGSAGLAWIPLISHAFLNTYTYNHNIFYRPRWEGSQLKKLTLSTDDIKYTNKIYTACMFTASINLPLSLIAAATSIINKTKYQSPLFNKVLLTTSALSAAGSVWANCKIRQ